MLGDNIKALRKQKGYSQETLALQLSVVRQTISKWEKGLSVPDAEMLEKMASLFDVTVGTLLGGSIPESETSPDINEVAAQLAILNARLAERHAFRKRFWRVILGIFIAMILIVILAVSLFSVNTSSTTVPHTEETIEIIE